MLTIKEVLVSDSDQSINVVLDLDGTGTIEARRVQRTEETLVIYLSSQTGCRLSCRFCHLTQMGETGSVLVTLEDYWEQARLILRDYVDDIQITKLTTVHMNFMSRGDALSNPAFTTQYTQLFAGLDGLVKEYLGPGVETKFKISTIFPTDMHCRIAGLDLKRLIVDPILALPYDVEFYYSLYTLNPEFRKRWIPKAISPDSVGRAFFGRTSGLRLHHALIKGENDGLMDVAMIHEWLAHHDLSVGFNLVRYNPYPGKGGEESHPRTLRAYTDLLGKSERVTYTQIVSRLDPKVFAACGMFMGDS